MLLAFKQGELTTKVESNICNNRENTKTIKENTEQIINLRIEIAKLTNEIKLSNY